MKIDIVITMPRWKDYNRAHRDEQLKWDDFYEKLLKHEHNHKDIEISIADELCRVLAELRTTAGKGFLLKIAADRANALYRKCIELNKQYDERTEHGLKEGIQL